MPRRLLDSLYDKLLSRLGLALLALALFVNLGALLAVDVGFDALDDARERAIQSREVTTEIHTIRILLLTAESAQRGFLYTDNKEYLKPLGQSEADITARLERLRTMVGDDPGRQKLLATIQAIVQEKLAELNKTIAVQEQKQKWADLQVARRWGFAGILFLNALMLLAGTVTIMRDMDRKRAELVRLDERAAVLASEVAQRAEELRALTAYLLRVQEEERRTIARELHDELGGTLSAVKMDIIMGRDAAAKRSDEKSVARLQRAHTSIDSAIQFTRRLIEDLRPTLLDNLGLEAALQSMVDQFCERTTVRCAVSLPVGTMDLTSAQSTALYRICQEALTNIMKYAKAKQVTIALTSDGAFWKLMLVDDGVGLEATKQHRSISHGLLGMRERIVALGGTFDIRGAAGEGTTLSATFPVAMVEPTK